ILGESCVDEELFNQRTALWSEVARLRDYGVPCSNRWNNLTKWDRQRIIPGGNDGDDAERLVHQASTLGFRSRAMGRHSLPAEETAGVGRPILGGVERHKDVCKERLHSRLSGLANYCICQFASRLQDLLAKDSQLAAALAHRQLRPA